MNREGGRTLRFTRHVPAFLLCAVVVVYCTYHLLSSLWPKPVLEPAMLEEYESTAVFDGYILRAEELLVAPTVGEALPICRDGEKVAAGQTVARVYASVNEDSYRALTDIRRRISILERAKTTYASLKDAPQIRALIERTVVEYNDAVRRNDLAAAQALQDTILAASAQYRALTEGYQSYAADIAALEAQSAALEAGLGAVLSSVSAPAGGCYYAAVDGLESVFHASCVDTLSVEGLRAMIDTEPEAYTAADRVAGKLVTEFTWYVATVTDSQTAESLVAGASYPVRFPVSDQTLSMTLYRTVASAREDAVLLVFSSNRMVEGFDFTRSQRIEVTLDSGVGYAVPKEAVRSLDGVAGVYVLDRYVVRFRAISIVGERNDVYYCDPSLTGEGCLQLYDSVIVGGKDLYDGKVLS